MADKRPYPERPRYWANKVQRALIESEAVATLGRDTCWLIAYVAAREDMWHYKHVPKWWTPQLMDDAGFTNKRHFLKTRQAAIDAGWLTVNGGGKGIEGEYFTEIPVQFVGANSNQQTHQQTDSRCEFAPANAPISEPTNAPLPFPCSPVTPVPQEVEGAALPSQPKKKFVKPTVHDVRDYAAEQSQPEFDAENFIDHYESNGWHVGKSAMKDWKATVRKWIRTDRTQGKGNGRRGYKSTAQSREDANAAAFNTLFEAACLEESGRQSDGCSSGPTGSVDRQRRKLEDIVSLFDSKTVRTGRVQADSGT